MAGHRRLARGRGTGAILFCLVSARLSCAQSLSLEEQRWLDSIAERNVRRQLLFLASDAMKGRDTPSVELDIAAAYIAAEFEASGLEGLTRDGYLQRIDLPGCRVRQEESALVLSSGGDGEVRLQGPADLVLLAGATENKKEIRRSRVVFCPDLDSLLDPSLDPRDSLVIASFRSRAAPAAGETTTNAGPPLRSPEFLSFRAVQSGIAAVLLWFDQGDEPMRAELERLTGRACASRLGGSRSARPVFATQHPRVGEWLAARAKCSPEELLRNAPAFDCEQEVIVQVPSMEALTLHSSNVLGILRGSDPDLRDECVFVTAHYDHIGVGATVKGDSIYNGADDDASGTVAVIELAAAFSRVPVAPSRSLVFGCFCAEEKGLRGSKAYVEAPLIPMQQTVANINLEMIGRPEDIGENKAWVTGYDYSDVGEILSHAARRMGVEIYRHPKLSDMLFRASDNWSFAEKGVPAHSVSAGSLHADYHQPGDEVGRLDIANMTRVIRALALGIQDLSSSEDRPQWNAENPVGRELGTGR